MKVYIMTDMEGVAGVVDVENFLFPGARYYELARELTTRETTAAIEGALEAGATDIVVCDGHGPGAINPVLLHPAAKLLNGRPLGYPFGCDQSFNAALYIGQHAKSNTDGGHLSHTGTMATEDLTINGVSLGELGCNFLVGGYFGVPYVFLSGDLAATQEARQLVPNIETVAVKEGRRRCSAAGLTERENSVFNQVAIHLSPERARSLIREHACRALKRAHEIKPFSLSPPYKLVYKLRRDEQNPPREATVTGDDLLQVLTAPMQFHPVT